MLPIKSAHQFDELKEIAKKNIGKYSLGSFSESITQSFVHNVVETNFKKYFKSKDFSLIATFNDFGQRCDDFKKDHDGLHVLYAGCSFTYAEGVPIENSWSWLVNEYINKNIAKTSGYFNVGKGGANFAVMENQIMGYIRYSGKPDIIFINLPEIGREHIEYLIPLRTLTDKENNIKREGDELIITLHRLRDRLENFSTFCSLLNIKLVIGCWALNADNYKELKKRYADPFYSAILDVIDVSVGTDGLACEDDMGYPDLEKEILDNLGADDPLRNIVYVAMDDAHPGLLGHRIMAEHFINKLKTVI